MLPVQYFSLCITRKKSGLNPSRFLHTGEQELSGTVHLFQAVPPTLFYFQTPFKIVAQRCSYTPKPEVLVKLIHVTRYICGPKKAVAFKEIRAINTQFQLFIQKAAFKSNIH